MPPVDLRAVEQTEMGEQLSETVTDRCILVVAATIAFTLLVNTWRISHNDVAPNLTAALLALGLSVVLLFGRRRIPLSIKIALVCVLGLVIAVPGLLLAGLAGPVIGWGLATAVFLVGAFYDWRYCLLVTVVVLGAMSFAGLGHVSGSLSHGLDVDRQALHPSKWLVFMAAAIAYGGVVLTAWYYYKKTVYQLIDESIVQSAELARLATIDELTGLPMLRLALDRLNMACKRARRVESRVALLLIDLDGFKSVNDSIGHDAGNHCLREIARRMSAVMRESDTVARIGGDEFLGILEPIDEFEQVSAIAHRLIQEIAQPIHYLDAEFFVSATIGISIFPDHGASVESLRRHADRAMYAAKKAGKDRFQFAGSLSPVPHNPTVPLDIPGLEIDQAERSYQSSS